MSRAFHTAHSSAWFDRFQSIREMQEVLYADGEPSVRDLILIIDVLADWTANAIGCPDCISNIPLVIAGKPGSDAA